MVGQRAFDVPHPEFAALGATGRTNDAFDSGAQGVRATRKPMNSNVHPGSALLRKDERTADSPR